MPTWSITSSVWWSRRPRRSRPSARRRKRLRDNRHPIRRASTEDAAGIAAVELLTAPEFATFLLEGLFGDASVGAILTWRYRQGGVDSTDWSWVACDSDGIVGAMGAYPVGLSMQEWDTDSGEIAERTAHFAPIRAMMRQDAFHIARLGVVPRARRQGLASALIETACDTARQRNDPLVSLVVWKDNHAALALYTGLGFDCMDSAEIAPHPRLTRHGSMLLLGRQP